MHRPPTATDAPTAVDAPSAVDAPGFPRRHGDRSSMVDPRPLAGYGVLLSLYTAVTGTATWLLHRRGAKMEPVGPMEIGMLALATMHISRLVTKDSVTGVLRAPFTTFDEPAGEGESNERAVRPGVGHAVGELLTCPFCTGQWVATALVLGRAAAPQLTAGAVTVAAAARLADFGQLLYGAARR